MASKISHLFLFLILAGCLLGTAACAEQPVYRPWTYADLRRLDLPDAPTPATDLIAVYTRTTTLSVDIRLDLLDMAPGDDYEVKLSLWDNHYFDQDPLTIEIHSNRVPRIGGTGNGKPVIRPRITKDYGLDTITINLNRAFIGDHYRFDVSTYKAGSLSPLDEILDVRSDAQPPLARAPLLLALWDAFPAATPTQALRRWDGAHTGPLGGRHGLKFVLDNAAQYQIPVALLDLKNPASLAALDFLEAMGYLRALNQRGLLILPDVAYSQPAQAALDFSRRAQAGFDLPSSRFVYAVGSAPNLMPGYEAQFLPLDDTSHLARTDGRRLIPLPAADAVEATADGPSLDVRRALLQAALSPDPSDLVLLGGSLPNSTWGDADVIGPTFEWIAAHPWIQPLTGEALLTFPVGERYTAPPPSAAAVSPWLEDLRAAPDNAIGESTWLAYLMLNTPTDDSRLQALQTGYLGQVGELLAAARWAEDPQPRAECADDLDADGQAECILANQDYFAVLDPAGARLTNLFYLDDNGPHQLVGPSSQFAVGLSDPSDWQPGHGEASDPGAVLGAFADDSATWVSYTPDITADEITFTSLDGSRIKVYRLTEAGLEVRYQVPGPISTRVPLAVDPQAFFLGPTNYQPSLHPHSWTWSLRGGIGIEVHSEATLSAQGFVSLLPFLDLPEDPNLDYPQGDYLPFPLSVVTLQGKGNFTLKCSGH